MMAAIVVTCQELGLTVSESKTESMRLWSVPSATEAALRIKAAGQRNKPTEKFVYFGGAISADAKRPSTSTAVSARRGHAPENIAPNSAINPTSSYP